MKTKDARITRLGDLVAAAFDSAERYSADPEVVYRLALGVVSMMLRTACRRAVISALQTKKDEAAIRLHWPRDKGSEQKTGQVS